MWKTQTTAQSTSDFFAKTSDIRFNVKISEVAILLVSVAWKKELQTSMTGVSNIRPAVQIRPVAWLDPTRGMIL